MIDNPQDIPKRLANINGQTIATLISISLALETDGLKVSLGDSGYVDWNYVSITVIYFATILSFLVGTVWYLVPDQFTGALGQLRWDFLSTSITLIGVVLLGALATPAKELWFFVVLFALYLFESLWGTFHGSRNKIPTLWLKWDWRLAAVALVAVVVFAFYPGLADNYWFLPFLLVVYVGYFVANVFELFTLHPRLGT